MILLWAFPTTLQGHEIAYFYALEGDLSALKQVAKSGENARASGGQSVTTISMGAHRIHAVKMGAGCIQTAVAAATVLARYRCDLAISTGPAGRLSNQFPVGDWLRVREVVVYQQGSETPAGFVAALNGSRRIDEKFARALPEALGKSPSVRLASGEIFVASGGFREQLRARTQADCVDMNLAGLAAACAASKVPLLAWKVISDSADESAAEDFQRFVKAYDGEGGRLVAELIKGLPADAGDPAAHSQLKSLLDSARDAPAD